MIASVPQYGSKILVWDAATGALLHEIDARGLFSREFLTPADYTFAFSPDGRMLAAGVGPDVCFWSLASGREVRRFRGGYKGVAALTFSRDARTFYCGGGDNAIHQWDIASGKRLRSWDYFERDPPRIYASGFPDKTSALKAISADGKTAVWLVAHWADNGNGVGRTDGKLTVWDVGTGKDRCEIKDADGTSFFGATVALSRDGRYVTAYTRNSEMAVWDATTGKKVKTLGAGGSVEAVAYSPDCRLVAAVTRGAGYTLSVWDVASGRELWCRGVSVWYAPGWDKSLAFAPDGRTVALAHWKNVRLWGVSSGKETPLLEGHRWPGHALAFLPGGGLISADDSCVCEWDAGHRQKARHPLFAYHGGSRSLAESYGSMLRVYQPEGKPPQLRELITDKLLAEFREAEGRWGAGWFSEDGRTVALVRGERSAEVVFLDIASRTVRSRVKGLGPWSGAAALSRDGKVLALPSPDQTVALVDSVEGKVSRGLGTPQAQPVADAPRVSLTTGAFSPDGRLLAFGTQVSRPGNRWGFGSLDALPKDTPGIRVWQVTTGRELRQFENCMAKAVHGSVASLRFSPDNKSLAVALTFNPWRPGDPDQAVVPVLEVTTGQVRRGFKGHTDQVVSVTFSPDGKILATGSHDSTTLLWDMNRPAGPDPAVGKSVAQRVRHHWNNLAKREAACAYDSVLFLSEMPGESVPFLAGRLKMAAAAPRGRIAQLIADLDDDSFRVRAEASAKLAALGGLARSALTEALGSKPSLEARLRMKRLVARIDAEWRSDEQVRELRCVDVLERIGSREARRLLEKLSAGAPEAPLTSEAKASLARLEAGRLSGR